MFQRGWGRQVHTSMRKDQVEVGRSGGGGRRRGGGGGGGEGNRAKTFGIWLRSPSCSGLPKIKSCSMSCQVPNTLQVPNTISEAKNKARTLRQVRWPQPSGGTGGQHTRTRHAHVFT